MIWGEKAFHSWVSGGGMVALSAVTVASHGLKQEIARGSSSVAVAMCCRTADIAMLRARILIDSFMRRYEYTRYKIKIQNCVPAPCIRELS